MIGAVLEVAEEPAIWILEEVEPKPDLFYRRNELHPTYLPIASEWLAEQLLGSTTFNSPWVTIIRGKPDGPHTYMQVLGTPDQLVVEGGGVKAPGRWDWRAIALPCDYAETTIGPPWYSEKAYESEVVTVHDALQLLWPALADEHGALDLVAGLKLWRY